MEETEAQGGGRTCPQVSKWQEVDLNWVFLAILSEQDSRMPGGREVEHKKWGI